MTISNNSALGEQIAQSINRRARQEQNASCGVQRSKQNTTFSAEVLNRWSLLR